MHASPRVVIYGPNGEPAVVDATPRALRVIQYDSTGAAVPNPTETRIRDGVGANLATVHDVSAALPAVVKALAAVLAGGTGANERIAGVQNGGDPFQNGRLAVGGRVFTGIPGLGTDTTAGLLRLDAQERLLVNPYSAMNQWTDGVASAVVLGIGGTTTVIAAPGANLRNNLTSWILSASAATLLTLESPSGTVRAVIRIVAAALVINGTFPVPLRGGSNAAWVLRTSAAATVDATLVGFTERES